MTVAQSSMAIPTSGAPLAILAAEVAVELLVIAVLGTLFAKGIARLTLRAGASKSVATSVRQWIAVLMITIGVAAVASVTGISSQFTTLTISGIAGLALSLALQSTLSNIISGVLMLQDGVLRIGDEVQFGGIRGEVVKVALRTTWIKSADGVIAVVGNSNLASGPIVNFTAKARFEKKLRV